MCSRCSTQCQPGTEDRGTLINNFKFQKWLLPFESLALAFTESGPVLLQISLTRYRPCNSTDHTLAITNMQELFNNQ